MNGAPRTADIVGRNRLRVPPYDVMDFDGYSLFVICADGGMCCLVFWRNAYRLPPYAEDEYLCRIIGGLGCWVARIFLR